MTSAITELAKLFTERNNINSPSFVYGKVISPLPQLKISDGDLIILDRDNLVVTDLFRKNLEVKAGDTVLMLNSNNGQEYIVIDRVVRI